MIRPHVLECPTCGGPLRFQVPFCAYCRAPVQWSETLELDRGAPIHTDRYPRDPLLGASAIKSRIDPAPEGHVLHVRAQGATWASAKKQLRDACVAVTAIAIDPGAGFAAIARVHTESGIADGYQALVVPGLRTVRLSRFCEGGDVSAVAPIRDWECSPKVAPAGYPNTIELRAADAMLQLFVNGERILSAIDAGLGFGSFGFRAIALEGPARVCFQSLEVFAVASSMRT